MAITDALQGLFDKASALSGVGSNYYARLGQIESSNNPNAKSKYSTAGGVFQFLDSTWNSYGTGSKYGTGDNVASAIAKFTGDNFAALKKALGRDPTQGELYLAHQQGAGGAIALLSNPNASATDIVGYDAVANNGGQVGMSAGAFASLWTSKFDGQQNAGGGSALGNLASMFNPATYINAAAGTTPANANAVESAAAQSAKETQAGWMDWLASGAIRGIVVILGFIFVAVGLAMFKPGIVVNAIPAARAAKGAASVLK